MHRIEMRPYVLRIVMFAAVGFFVPGFVVPQVTEADLRRLVQAESWSSEELAAFEKGNAVVRSLKSKDKQELATLGVVRISRLPIVTMEMFRQSLNQRSDKVMKTGGRFNEPPVITDLNDLELDDETIAQLRKCAVRDCDLNLSAATIEQVRTIDWTSPAARQNATQMIREMLVTYAQTYTSNGITSLGNYDNRHKSVNLIASHRALLDDSSPIRELAPELSDYLQKYPFASLSNVENTLRWSVVDFGLKPSITLSHAAAYSQVAKDVEHLFFASRQIYSSRYLDASLSFAILVRVGSEEPRDAYLLFLDRSRSDALEGPLGSMARSIVRKEAAERVRKMLDRAHLRLLAFASQVDRKTEDSNDESFFTWPVISIIAIGSAVVLWLAIVMLRRPTTPRYKSVFGVRKSQPVK